MNILLTGAGFSRNWGGWLANEAFEFLLGSQYIDDHIKMKLWTAKEAKLGFEDVLAQMQSQYEYQPYGQPEEELRGLTTAIAAMFAEMAAGYAQTRFESDEHGRRMQSFLMKFEAIYTLNQDTLLEQHYHPKIEGGRFTGAASPGVAATGETIAIGKDRFRLYAPDPQSFRLHRGTQPYYKLHGSFNWLAEARDLMLILGGNKAANIKKQPLLNWYYDQFKNDLNQGSCRLMIIGYSFNDRHINDLVVDAVTTNGLKLFIVDPLGVDVIDKRNPTAQIREPQTELIKKLIPAIIGASRRPISSTFSADVVEHSKITKFFA